MPETTAAVVERLGLQPEQYAISFQSRLGPEKWLTPTTENELERMAREGVQRMLVVCPAFVSDCLETLEEIASAARKILFHGAESLSNSSHA